MYHDDVELTAEQIEDGTYFRRARQWYSDIHHFPIAERSFYIIIIVLAIVNGVFAMQAFNGIFPLNVKVPFLTYSEDAWIDMPVAKKIAERPTENKNAAVRRFMLQSYVTNRESYDLDHYELRYRNIASQSTSGVFEKYKENMDAKNLYSPYRIYTNRFRRDIAIEPSDTGYGFDLRGKEAHATIIFYASITNIFDGHVTKRSKFQADIDFQYVNFEVDQSLDSNVWIARILGLTGDSIKVSGEKRKIVPMKFVVSGYNVRELLE